MTNINMTKMNKVLGLTFLLLLASACTQSVSQQSNDIKASASSPLRATGDLGVVIERATSQVQIVNHSSNTMLSEIDGLGDLSHASIVYSRDQRFAYVFARDGGLTKIDMLQDKIAKRIIQSGNSIGGAISQDGKLIAVSNYTPGGVTRASCNNR